MLAFIFDIDGTLADSNELHVDSWDGAFRVFGKQFPREKLRAQIGKSSDHYLPNFLMPDEIGRFGKELDDYRSDLFKQEYLPRCDPPPTCVTCFNESVTKTSASCSQVRARKPTRNITSTFLRSAILSRLHLRRR